MYTCTFKRFDSLLVFRKYHNINKSGQFKLTKSECGSLTLVPLLFLQCIWYKHFSYVGMFYPFIIPVLLCQIGRSHMKIALNSSRLSNVIQC